MGVRGARGWEGEVWLGASMAFEACVQRLQTFFRMREGDS